MENNSTYNGRKIRIEGKEEEHQNVQQPVLLEKDQMTFGEAVKAGIVKEGMYVSFGDVGRNSSKIKLTTEMTGVEQEIEFYLKQGVVMKKANGAYAVFAVLSAWPHIKFQGRFARANALSTVIDMLNNISNIQISLATVEDLRCACDNYLLCDYVVWNDASIYSRGDELVCFFARNGIKRLSFVPGGPIAEYSTVAVNIGNYNMICTIKDNPEIKTQALPAFGIWNDTSPFPKHLYVEGVLK